MPLVAFHIKDGSHPMAWNIHSLHDEGLTGHLGVGVRHVLAVSSAALVVLSVGCSGSRVAPVSGRVTLDGKPLASVHVNFQPISEKGKMNPGSGSYAITDADGKFTLLLVSGENPGAVVGQHRVEITARSEVPENIDVPKRPPPKVFVPAKYNQNSELTFNVATGGTTTADFELKSQ